MFWLIQQVLLTQSCRPDAAGSRMLLLKNCFDTVAQERRQLNGRRTLTHGFVSGDAHHVTRNKSCTDEGRVDLQLLKVPLKKDAPRPCRALGALDPRVVFEPSHRQIAPKMQAATKMRARQRVTIPVTVSFC